MPKKSHKQSLKPSIDLENQIMSKVKSGEITMKPKWYFLVGTLVMYASIVGLSIGAIFMANVSLFLLRHQGPRYQWRLDLMLTTFPWWIPILAVIGCLASIWLLKQYDFSYKKNYRLIVVGFVLALLMSAWIIDVLRINETWAGRGPMRRFYKKWELTGEEAVRQPGYGKNKMWQYLE